MRCRRCRQPMLVVKRNGTDVIYKCQGCALVRERKIRKVKDAE